MINIHLLISFLREVDHDVTDHDIGMIAFKK